MGRLLILARSLGTSRRDLGRRKEVSPTRKTSSHESKDGAGVVRISVAGLGRRKAMK